MTIQIGDIYKYNGQEYACLEKSNPGPFIPSEYGFQPSKVCTACLNGYWCEYEIADDRIILQTLNIHDTNNCYPVINGVSIPSKEFSATLMEEDEEYDPTVEPRYWSTEKYKQLELVLPYTGKLLLGDYYIGCCYAALYESKELLSLEFDNGKLIGIEDYSETAHMLRKVCKRSKKELNVHYIDDMELYDRLPEKTRSTLWWYDVKKERRASFE